MDLVRTENNKRVTELKLVSEYFNKRHKDLTRDINKLINTDPTLTNEFIPYQYADKYGRKQPSYYLTEEGFCLLAMGFTGRKALAWKRKFYKAFKDLQTENSKLKAFIKDFTRLHGDNEDDLINAIKNHIGPILGQSRYKALTARNLELAFKDLQTKNSSLTNYLNTINNTGMTYCITDICCKFKGLLPYQANLYLLERGIIEKRASGYYPSLHCLEWCVPATAWDGEQLQNYVRYTPKGVEQICNLLVNDGYEFLKIN